MCAMNRLVSFQMTYPGPDDPKIPGKLLLLLELSSEFLNRLPAHQGQGTATHLDLSEEWIVEAISASDLFRDKCRPQHVPPASRGSC